MVGNSITEHVKVAEKIQNETYEQRKLCFAREVYLRRHKSAPSGRSWVEVWETMYKDNYAAYLKLKTDEKNATITE